MSKNKPKLKILVPHSSPYEKISVISLIFEKLVPHLDKKFDTQIIRLVYQYGEFTSKIETDLKQYNLDIHNFHDAVDAVKIIKPDLIYVNPDLDFINPSFVAASRICNVPTFNLIFHEPFEKINHFKHFKAHLSHLTDSDIPTDSSYQSVKFARVKFIFYKFLFCLRTFKKVYPLPKFFKSIFLILKAQYFQLKHLDPKFAINLHCLLNKNQYDDLKSHGFQEETLYLVGNPMFDDLFLRKNQLKDKNQIPSILFVPDPFYEHGDWTKSQSDFIFKEIIKKLNDTNFSVKIKIHPSASKLEYYQKLLDDLEIKIPIFQSGSIEDFLYSADLVITYSSLSTGIQYAALLGIPIIICNFFNREDNIWSLKDSNLALEIKDVDELLPKISESLKDNSTSKSNLKQYVEKYLYKDDGKASERMANAIFNLLEKSKPP